MLGGKKVLPWVTLSLVFATNSFMRWNEELFHGSNASGSLVTDQEICLDDGKVCDDGDDSGGLNDISGYAHPIDL
jgi:hypothetical protein